MRKHRAEKVHDKKEKLHSTGALLNIYETRIERTEKKEKKSFL